MTTARAARKACQGVDCAVRQMIAGPEGARGCGTPPHLGMVDSGVHTGHEALQGARMAVHHIAPDQGLAVSDRLHGTAVSALLVGQSGSRTQGLVPQAELIAVDAFHKQKSDERADAFTLIEALDYLTVQGVDIVNLSLADPPN